MITLFTPKLMSDRPNGYPTRRPPIVVTKDGFYLEYPYRFEVEPPSVPDRPGHDVLVGPHFLMTSWYTAQNPGHNLSHLLRAVAEYETQCPTAKIVVDSASYKRCKLTQELMRFYGWEDRIVSVAPDTVVSFENLVVPPNFFDSFHTTECLPYVDLFIQRIKIQKPPTPPPPRLKVVVCKLPHHTCMASTGYLHTNARRSFEKEGWTVIDVEKKPLVEIVWILHHCTHIYFGTGAVNYAHRRFVSPKAKMGFLFAAPARNYHFENEPRTRRMYFANIDEKEGCTTRAEVMYAIKAMDERPDYNGYPSQRATAKLFHIPFRCRNPPEFIRHADTSRMRHKCLMFNLQQENELLIQLSLTAPKNAIVMDVGAFNGNTTIPWALGLKKKGRDDIRVIAVEPSEHQASKITKDAAGLNVKVVQAVASEKTGKATGVGPVKGPAQMYQTGIEGTIESRPVDTIVSDPVYLLKIDVEGMEMSVLRGAQRTIKDVKYVYIEMWADQHHAFRRGVRSEPTRNILLLLRGAGFVPLQRVEKNVLFAKADDPAVRWPEDIIIT